MGTEASNFKLRFQSALQKLVFLRLLLFFSVFNSGDFCEGQKNEIESLADRNFQKSESFFKFSDMKYLFSTFGECEIHCADFCIFHKKTAKNVTFKNF